MGAIETDYLVVGAGASALAFTDALISEADVDVTLVDRRARPGGHWNDAYDFVRLHQPSAMYGVNSLPLGADTIDQTGTNAGFYERATGVEIREYFGRVLHQLLASGQVRHFPVSNYLGEEGQGPAFESLLTGATTDVTVRRAIVDTTYLDVSVPARHRPSFTSSDDAQVIPVSDLSSIGTAPTGFTVLGSGKTAMDTCSFLLENGVDPDSIRWVRPREALVTDRSYSQPLDLLGVTLEGFAAAVEVLAQAGSMPDLFAGLESCGQVMRIDPNVEATMFRGAILSRAERDQLQQIERVERLGHVTHIGDDRICLNGGEVPTTRGELHVDCTARGLGPNPARPIFEDGHITVQSLSGGFTTYNSALLGYIEGTRDDLAEKNRLAPPVAAPATAKDWIAFYRSLVVTAGLHGAEPDLATFQDEKRLSLTCGMSSKFGDPQVSAAVERWLTQAEAAVDNADRLLASA